MEESQYVNITIIDRHGENRVVEVPLQIDLNLMEVCIAENLPVRGTCGGMALCSSCHCYIKSDHALPELSTQEENMLDQAFDVKENSRLGCQLKITPELEGLVAELATDELL